MAQEMTHATAVAAAGMVGIISIANGSGRLLWAWLSDFTGRRPVFLSMFPLQAVVLKILPQVQDFAPLAALSFVGLLRYGGGFRTIPAFAAGMFAPSEHGSIRRVLW